MSAEDALSSDVAKLLTHVEGEVREKTVQKIVRYLKMREKSVGRLDDLELQRLWKALYYCFWMTDKVPVQLEMGRTLAEMCRGFTRMDNIHAYFTSFFFVLRREWGGVDYLRMNKFLAWIRQMMNEWMLRVYSTNFDDQVVQEFVELVRDQVLLPHQSDGIRMQVAFVYLTELMNVAGPGLKEPVLREFLSPFLCVLLAPPSEAFLQATIKDVFDMLNANEFIVASTGESKSFLNLDRSKVGAAIFDMAAADESLTAQRRKLLYSMAKKFESRSKSSSSTATTSNEEETEQARKKARLLVEEMERRKNSNNNSSTTAAADEADDDEDEDDEMDVEEEEEEKRSHSVKKNKSNNKSTSSAAQKKGNQEATSNGGDDNDKNKKNNTKKQQQQTHATKAPEKDKVIESTKKSANKVSKEEIENEEAPTKATKKTKTSSSSSEADVVAKKPTAAESPIAVSKKEKKATPVSAAKSEKTKPKMAVEEESAVDDVVNSNSSNKKSADRTKKSKVVEEESTIQQEQEQEESNLDQSFVSTTSVSSKKSVRFSHKDIMRIPAINKRMKENQGKKASELGQPTKSLLKKTSSVSSSSTSAASTPSSVHVQAKKNKTPKLSLSSSSSSAAAKRSLKKMTK